MVTLLLLLLTSAPAASIKGELRAYRSVEVYAKETGFVSRVLVGRGDTVKEGELLAEVHVDVGEPLQEIRAPFTGVVAECWVMTGARVGPGARRHETALFEVAEVARLRIVAPVPHELPAGTRIEFSVDGARRFGTLERTARRAGVLTAEVAVSNEDRALRPGTVVEVFWP